MGSLDGRVALVSGGGRGIGRGIAQALAAEGAAVAVNYRRDRDAGDATVAAIEAAGGMAEAYGASVDDADADAAMVEEVLDDLGSVDLLVANAGVASRGNTVADTDPTRSVGCWPRMPSAPTTCPGSCSRRCASGPAATS